MAGTPLAPEAKDLAIHLSAMRDAIAAGAPNTDLTDFVNASIARWTRLISLHRDGCLPGNSDAYQAISHSTVSTVANVGNVLAAGFGDLAMTLGLLQYGADGGRWTLSAPSSGPISDGAVVAKGNYIDAKPRPLFILRAVGQGSAGKPPGRKGLVSPKYRRIPPVASLCLRPTSLNSRSMARRHSCLTRMQRTIALLMRTLFFWLCRRRSKAPMKQTS